MKVQDDPNKVEDLTIFKSFKTSIELGIKGSVHSTRGDKLIYIALCLANLLYNVCITIVIPFFPPMAHFEAGLDYGIIGFVISGMALGSIISGLMMPKRIPIYGRKYLLLKALLIQCFAVFIFGLLPFITKYKILFLVVSLICRVVEGICRGTFGSLSFVYIPFLYPNSIEKKQGIMKSFIVLGIMVGPAVGAFLNAIYDTIILFNAITLIYIGLYIFFKYMMPSDSTLNLQAPKKNYTFFRSFKHGQFIATFCLICIVVGCLTYTGPTFIGHMKSFDFSTDLGAFLFSLPAVSYIFCLLIVPILQEHYHKGILMLFGLLLTIIAGSMIAPIWSNNPNNDLMIISGQLIAGIGQAFCVIPSIARVAEVMKPLYPPKAPVQNIAPGVFLMAISTGNFFAPNIGGWIYSNFHGKSIDKFVEKRAFQQSLLIEVVLLSISLLLFCTFRDPANLTDDIDWEDSQSEIQLQQIRQSQLLVPPNQQVIQFVPNRQSALITNQNRQSIRVSTLQRFSLIPPSQRQSVIIQL